MARFQAWHLLNLCKYVRDLSEVDFENDMKIGHFTCDQTLSTSLLLS